jgi:hypothetical protein
LHRLPVNKLKQPLKIWDLNPKNRMGLLTNIGKKIVNGKLYKVTVDCPKAPFSETLVKSMAAQAGVSKKVFLQYCFDKKLRDDPHQ